MKEVLQVAYLRHLQDFYLFESVKDGIITFPVSSHKWHSSNFHATAYASDSSVKYLLLLPLRCCLIPLRTHNEIAIVLKDHMTGKFCTVVIP